MIAGVWHPATLWIASNLDGKWKFSDGFLFSLVFILPFAFILGTILGIVLAFVGGRSESKQLLNLNGRAFVVGLCATLWVAVVAALGLAGWEASMTLHQLLGAVLLLTFSALSILHIYWAFGGRRGLLQVIPEVDGEPVFRLDFNFSFLTLGVAFLLAMAGGLCAVQGRLLWISPCEWSRLGMWCLSAVFALRAIGEFRLVGFFKRVKGTTFATWDTRLFSPLCLAIAVLAATLAGLPL